MFQGNAKVLCSRSLKSSSLISAMEKSFNSKTQKELTEVDTASRFSKNQSIFINASQTWLVCEIKLNPLFLCTTGSCEGVKKEQNSEILYGGGV